MRPKRQTLAGSGSARHHERARRPTLSLERMLRTHCLQHWFSLSVRAVEEALYEPPAMRGFVDIDVHSTDDESIADLDEQPGAPASGRYAIGL